MLNYSLNGWRDLSETVEIQSPSPGRLAAPGGRMIQPGKPPMAYQQPHPRPDKLIRRSRTQPEGGQQGIAGQPQMDQRLPLQQPVVGQPMQFPPQQGPTPPSPVQGPAVVRAQPVVQPPVAQPIPSLQPVQPPVTQQAVQSGGTSASVGPYALAGQQPVPVQPAPPHQSMREPSIQQPALIQPGQPPTPRPAPQQPVFQPVRHPVGRPSFYQPPPQPVQQQPMRQAHRPLPRPVVRQPVQPYPARRQPAQRVSVRGRVEGEPAGMIDYSEVVDGTVEEVKERVATRSIDIECVLEAERAGEARVTLIEWLETRRED